MNLLLLGGRGGGSKLYRAASKRKGGGVVIRSVPKVRFLTDLHRNCLPLLEAHDFGVADVAGEDVGEVEVGGDFLGVVGVGVDDDGDVPCMGGDQEVAARINFPDVLAQPG